MFIEDIPADVKTTTEIKIQYDCDGGFERCGKIWILKYKDAKKNYEKNNNRHVCRQCSLVTNNPASRPEVKEKMKQTCLERYGTELPINSKENIAARVEKMFGTEESTQNIVEKRKETSRLKYGADHPMKNKEIKEKQQSILQEKYGTSVPLQNEQVLAKMQKTVYDRYGVENVAQLPEVQLKMAKTSFEKYGVEHYNQLPEMKEYLRENCKEWLAESWANPWAKGITRPEEWNQKQSETMAELIVSGKFNPEDSRFYITGYFHSEKCKKKRAFFRSSLEIRAHYLFHNDDDVLWYENEPFSIPYKNQDGNIRNYIPDFFVFRKNNKAQLVEIKPAFRMREDSVKIKSQIAENYSKENNCDFICLDEKFLKEKVTLSIEELKKIPLVEINQIN